MKQKSSKKREKVILINIEVSPSLFFPIIQEILLNRGNECKCIHIPLQRQGRISEKELISVVSQLKKICMGAGLIGISCMTNTFLDFIKLAKQLKKWEIPLVVGGIHATVRPEECLEYVDYVCVGEGEEVLVELVDRIEKRKKTDNIKNIWLKKGNKIIKNKLRPLIKDLSKLPTPSFDLKDLFIYHNGKIRCLKEDKKLIKKYYREYYYIMSSRGCPYRCRYCLNDCLIKIKKDFAKIRKRSKEHIIKELKKIKEILPNKTIGFVDDDFFAKSYEELRDFCELYKKEINMPFLCASTPTSMSEEKVNLLIDSGLIRLEVGIQTINDKVNKEIYGRYTVTKQIIKTVRMLEKYRHKVAVCYDFILDNHWESDKSRMQSLKFILSIKKPVTFFLFSLTLYPGTSLNTKAKEEGIIKNDYIDVYKKNHALLNNSYVNTLFILYARYNFPSSVIRFLIKTRNFLIIKDLLGRSTYFLLRSYNYYEGLKYSIKKKDFEYVAYYLKAPIKKILKI